ncbi:MAG TPA: PIG-L family deacetylase [Eubacteriales bacterium]|jgi:LmbE family N-acetylglucosaminyl deacetylase|nr:PIG-L family deacetylase [Eubacteriales bacterium]
MPKTEVYIPEHAVKTPDLAMAIVAHQDDAEIMFASYIVDAYFDKIISFSAVVLTDGKGSARSGEYKNFADDEMKEVRKKEQKAAADIGRYESLFLLDFSSAELKKNPAAAAFEIKKILLEKRPKIVLLHNPFDKHPTHAACLKASLLALLEIKDEYSPKQAVAGEAWRGLDWLPEKYKLAKGGKRGFRLQRRLLAAFESQIAGGKRYDLAAEGRRRANATFGESHSVDDFPEVSLFLDLTKVVKGEIPLQSFVREVLEEFSKDVMKNL